MIASTETSWEKGGARGCEKVKMVFFALVRSIRPGFRDR